jgi:hypothetical protein
MIEKMESDATRAVLKMFVEKRQSRQEIGT